MQNQTSLSNVLGFQSAALAIMLYDAGALADKTVHSNCRPWFPTECHVALSTKPCLPNTHDLKWRMRIPTIVAPALFLSLSLSVSIPLSLSVSIPLSLTPSLLVLVISSFRFSSSVSPFSSILTVVVGIVNHHHSKSNPSQ